MINKPFTMEEYEDWKESRLAMKVSNCCGAPSIECYEAGIGYEDVGICSECKEHCEYLEEDDED